jgi:hypothetical protein
MDREKRELRERAGLPQTLSWDLHRRQPFLFLRTSASSAVNFTAEIAEERRGGNRDFETPKVVFCLPAGVQSEARGEKAKFIRFSK